MPVLGEATSAGTINLGSGVDSDISICEKEKATHNAAETPTHRLPQPSSSNRLNLSATPFTDPSTTCFCASANTANVLLQTARATLVNPYNHWYRMTISIIFDSGSQRSHVSEIVSKHLQLRSRGKRAMFSVMFGSRDQEPITCEQMDIGIEHASSTGPRKLEVFSVPLICEPIMSAPMTNSMVVVDHFKGLDLADTTIKMGQPFKPGLLIGYYWSFIFGGTIRTPQNGPIAM